MFEVKCNANVWRQGQASECGRLIARADSISEAVRRASEIAHATCDEETGKWKCSGCQNVGWYRGKSGDAIHGYVARGNLSPIANYLTQKGEL